jgi:uncharacterized damage-inducible protein DinB
MDRMQRLRRLLAYDDWANRETLAALRAAGSAPAKSSKVLAHVIGAERLWLDRLKRAKPKVAVWPDLSLDRCRDEIAELDKAWEDYLDDLAPEDLERTIDYVNSKGESWSSTVNDVLTHVLLHSAYHRGQIASELRDAGCEPAYTDFIHAVRKGLVE